MRTTSRKAFSYVCRIGVSFDASGSPLTRSAGCHPPPSPRSFHSPFPSAVHDPFCPFSCHRARARARFSFARHVRRMNDNLRVLDSPPAGKAFSSHSSFRPSAAPLGSLVAAPRGRIYAETNESQASGRCQRPLRNKLAQKYFLIL